MKKPIISLLLLLALVPGAAQAVDLSKRLATAKPTKKRYSIPAWAQKIWADPLTITGVEYDSTGWEQGFNSQGGWVWAKPEGEWWIYFRYGKCGNRITGRQPRVVPKKKELSYSVEVVAKVKAEAVPCEPLCLPPPNFGGRETPPGYPINYGSEAETFVPLAVPFIYQAPRNLVRVEKLQPPPTPPPGEVCPGVNPPPKPNPGVVIGDPSGPGNVGGIRNPPPPANPGGHGTAGAAWDPSPSHQNVADQVIKGPDGVPIR